MGRISLEDFRSEVDASMGNRSTDPTRLNRWVNFGYLDLAGAIWFDELSKMEDLVIDTGPGIFSVPDDTLAVRSVRDKTNNNMLTWIDPTDYFRRDHSETGAALRWTRVDNNIRLHPTPAGGAFTALLFVEPPPLAGDADVTLLPAVWDPAIILFGTHHGLLAVGEDEKAIVWFNRAVTYVRSRIDDRQKIRSLPGLGLTVDLPSIAEPEPAR